MATGRSSGPVVVLGGGVAGLVAALLVAERGRQPRDVIVVERAPHVGGLLSSFDMGPYGRFDHGMHTFTSSGIEDLDALVRGLLPESEWVVMEGERRDLSGVVFEGVLQRDSHYPDLRSLPPDRLRQCVADFFLNLAPTNGVRPPADLAEFFRARFGPAIARDVFEPIVKQFFGFPAAELDPIVAKIFPLDRVSLFDEPLFKDLMKSDLLRASVCYPNQRNLPLRFSSGRYSLYPRSFGSHRLPDALLARLREAGVTVKTSTALSTLEFKGELVSGLTIEDADGGTRIESPEHVFWTVGWPGVARCLNLPSAGEPLETRRTPAVMNLLLDRPIDTGDLYYFWVWDPRYQTYRITNYANYCPTAARARGWPVGFEFALRAGEETDEEALGNLAIAELRALGVFPDNASVLCSVGKVLPVGFPTLTLRNRVLIERLGAEFRERGVRNLSVSGIQAEWGIIYQPDVLAHVYGAVNRFLESA